MKYNNLTLIQYSQLKIVASGLWKIECRTEILMKIEFAKEKYNKKNIFETGGGKFLIDSILLEIS